MKKNYYSYLVKSVQILFSEDRKKLFRAVCFAFLIWLVLLSACLPQLYACVIKQDQYSLRNFQENYMITILGYQGNTGHKQDFNVRFSFCIYTQA